MRGRAFAMFVIVYEVQNLTTKQMKILVTSIGLGTQIVCLGNIAQIDVPYFIEDSSGLTYMINRFKVWRYGRPRHTYAW